MMGVRVLSDSADDMACMYDSVTETAFGPIFHGDTLPDMAATDAMCTFIEWLEPTDARDLGDGALLVKVSEFVGSYQRDYRIAQRRAES